MFQGMFRKRGRPPDPPLQIGGYDKSSHEESNQIPVHQLRDAPRQLPLPANKNNRGLATRLLNQVRYHNNMMLIC